MKTRTVRPPKRNRAERGAAIGLDIGGTKIAGGLVTSAGQVLTKRVTPTLPQRGPAAVLADALALAKQLRADAETQGLRLTAVGVGVCELVDARGRILSAQTIDWRGVPVRRRFAALAPAVVEADSRAAGFCEARLGAGRRFRSFFYVTVGTGIGSSVLLEGRPHTGARGCTGTLAGSPMSTLCGECGKLTRPVLEHLASGPALVARYNRRTHRRIAKAEEVLAAATAGDRDALHVIETAAEALGAALALMVNVLDPESVIVGGGLGTAPGLFWQCLVAATRRHIWSEAHRELPIVQAAFGGDAGLVGAALLALESVRPGGEHSVGAARKPTP